MDERRTRAIIAINTIMAAGTFLYAAGLAIFTSVDQKWTPSNTAFFVALLLMIVFFGGLGRLAARGHERLASDLWLFITPVLFVVNMVPDMALYFPLLIVVMVLVILAAGLMYEESRTLPLTIAVMMTQVAIYLLFDMSYPFSLVLAALVTNVTVAALVEEWYRDQNLLKTTYNDLRVMFDNNPTPVVLLDRNGHIREGNAAFHEMFPQCGADGFDMCLSPPFDERFSYHQQQVLLDRQPRQVEIMTNDQGEARELEAVLVPREESDEIVVSLRDLSDERELSRVKDNFISNVVHEMRAPITSLKLYHDLLTRKPEDASRYMDRISRETTRMTGILEGMRTLTSLEEGHITLEWETIDVRELLNNLVTDRAILAEEKGVTLRMIDGEHQPSVRADRHLLTQVFSVLLSNALHYTPAGGRVDVKVNENAVYVRDTGPGISADEQAKIFQRFYRGAVGKVKSGGSGLGLSIALAIVERFGGGIRVKSTPGEGATFIVTLW